MPAMRRLRWLWVLVVCAWVVLAAGCAPRERARADGRVEIVYWEKWTGFEGDAMRAVVDAFNRRQDRIWVEFLTVSQVDQKFLLSTAGGNPPDLAGLWSANTSVYADMGAIQPLDQYCAEAGITPEQFIPSMIGEMIHRGHIWALPTAPASLALHYNKALFRQAGLDPERPPRTIEELDAMAERLTRRDERGQIDVAGFLPSDPGWWNFAWGQWFGATLWDGDSQLTITSPENVRAFEWVQSYARKYGAKDLQSFQSGFGNFSSPQNSFLAGKVAMQLQGVWLHNFVDKYQPGLEYGVAPFPYPADRPDLAGHTFVDVDNIVIPTGARHPREAFEFIRFLATPEGAELLANGQGKFSPLRAVTPGFYQQHKHPYLQLFVDLSYGPSTFGQPKLQIWRELSAEMGNAFTKIWLDEQPARAALEEVQARMQPKLERELRAKRRKGQLP